MTDRTGRPLHITQNTLRILSVLFEEDAPIWGVDLAHLALMPYSTAHRVILRLVDHGWVETVVEVKGTHRSRPARHLYALTPDGRLRAKAIFETEA